MTKQLVFLYRQQYVKTVADCESCTAQGTRPAHQMQLHMFTAGVPLELPAVEILNPLAKDKMWQDLLNCLYRPIHEADKWNTGHYSKIDDRCYYIHRQLGCLIRYINIPNDLRRTAIRTEVPCSRTCSLRIKHLIKTTYQFQNNGELEKIKRTIVVHLGLCVEERQADWDQYGQLLKYAYNAQVYRLTGTTSFTLALCRQSPG